jgi:photosystem II stability/assembly factor-like uncharacterized protein
MVSAYVRSAVVLFSLCILSVPATADLWLQTDWSGGPGQLSWSDSTMYYAGTNVDGWRNPGDLKLNTPNDANWVNTGDLTGADYAYDIIESTDGSFYAAAGPGGDVFKSTDAGTTWVNTGELVGPNYVHSLLEASDGTIYAGTGPTNGDVFKTTDAGSTWVNTGDLAGAAYVWTLLQASDGAIYAGTANNLMNDGNVYKTVDAGTTWVETGNLAGASQVMSLIQASDGAIYAGTPNNGDVFKTVDAGTTWVNTGNLSGVGWVYDLLEGSDGALYAGTGVGNGDVFKSTDAGSTWANTGNLSGASWVTRLLQTSDGAIYAGTYPDANVFKSVNAGTSWANTGNLSGASDVYALLEASDGALYAGTWWNGDVFKAGYYSSGSLESSVLELANASVTYGVMSWTETPDGQLTELKVRTDTLPDMSTALDWDTCPPVLNGQDISGLSSVFDHSMYIQYQYECSTYRSDVTPVLHDVSIDYTVDVEGPIPDSAVASDGTNPLPGIDDDDYVLVYFDQPGNTPYLDALNIDSVLLLSGGHSWLDGFGGLDTTYWNPAGDRLMIRLSVEVSPPTIAVGDTITPDGVTITDEWGNPCIAQVVIGGSFDSPGVAEGLKIAVHQSSRLFQNRPNPFGSRTNLKYSVARCAQAEKIPVRLSVYDMTGRLVEVLLDEQQAAGLYAVTWDAGSNPGGIYFCTLNVGGFTETRKMVLAR